MMMMLMLSMMLTLLTMLMLSMMLVMATAVMMMLIDAENVGGHVDVEHDVSDDLGVDDDVDVEREVDVVDDVDVERDFDDVGALGAFALLLVLSLLFFFLLWCQTNLFASHCTIKTRVFAEVRRGQRLPYPLQLICAYKTDLRMSEMPIPSVD